MLGDEGDRRWSELRRCQPGVNLLPYIDELLDPSQLENISPRRTTERANI